MELRLILADDLGDQQLLADFERQIYRAAATLTLRGEPPVAPLVERTLLKARLTERFRLMEEPQRTDALRSELEQALEAGDADRVQMLYDLLTASGTSGFRAGAPVENTEERKQALAKLRSLKNKLSPSVQRPLFTPSGGSGRGSPARNSRPDFDPAPSSARLPRPASALRSRTRQPPPRHDRSKS